MHLQHAVRYPALDSASHTFQQPPPSVLTGLALPPEVPVPQPRWPRRQRARPGRPGSEPCRAASAGPGSPAPSCLPAARPAPRPPPALPAKVHLISYPGHTCVLRHVYVSSAPCGCAEADGACVGASIWSHAAWVPEPAAKCSASCREGWLLPSLRSGASAGSGLVQAVQQDSLTTSVGDLPCPSRQEVSREACLSVRDGQERVAPALAGQLPCRQSIAQLLPAEACAGAAVTPPGTWGVGQPRGLRRHLQHLWPALALGRAVPGVLGTSCNPACCPKRPCVEHIKAQGGWCWDAPRQDAGSHLPGAAEEMLSGAPWTSCCLGHCTATKY